MINFQAGSECHKQREIRRLVLTHLTFRCCHSQREKIISLFLISVGNTNLMKIRKKNVLFSISRQCRRPNLVAYYTNWMSIGNAKHRNFFGLELNPEIRRGAKVLLSPPTISKTCSDSLRPLSRFRKLQ